MFSLFTAEYNPFPCPRVTHPYILFCCQSFFVVSCVYMHTRVSVSFVLYRHLCRYVFMSHFLFAVWMCVWVCVFLMCHCQRSTLFHWAHHCICIRWLTENNAHGLAWPKAAVNVRACVRACVWWHFCPCQMHVCEPVCHWGAQAHTNVTVCVCCDKNATEAERDEDRQKVIRWIRDGGKRNGEERICNKEVVTAGLWCQLSDVLSWL